MTALQPPAAHADHGARPGRLSPFHSAADLIGVDVHTVLTQVSQGMSLGDIAAAAGVAQVDLVDALIRGAAPTLAGRPDARDIFTRIATEQVPQRAAAPSHHPGGAAYGPSRAVLDESVQATVHAQTHAVRAVVDALSGPVGVPAGDR